MNYNLHYRWLRLVVLSLLISVQVYADRLNQNTLPAERMRGCRFSETFENENAVISNNGSLVGSPTINFGLQLNGTSQYAVYNLTGQEFNSASLSIVVEFTPDFAADEERQRYFFDADDGAGNHRTSFYHYIPDDNYQLIIDGTCIGNISEATIGAHWLQNQRNVLVISSTSGDTDVYLNNVLVMDSDASAWTAQADLDHLVIGASYIASSKLSGTIHSLKVFHAKLSADEASDYSDNSTFTYLDKAIVFPMTIGHEGGTVVRDASDTYSLTKVGSPTKLNHRGYSFDGTNDYLYRASDGTFNPSGDFSVMAVVRPDDVAGVEEFIIGKYKVVGNDRSWALEKISVAAKFYVSDDGTFGAGHGVLYSGPSCFAAHRLTFIVVSYKYTTDGNSHLSFYADQLASVSHTNVDGPVYTGAAPLVIGADGDTNRKFPGDILYAAYLPGIALTRLQVLDWMSRIRTQLTEP